MALIISNRVSQKLSKKHNITKDEIEQCFADRRGRYLIDNREDHQTNPPSMWFVAETDFGKVLKIVFLKDAETGDYHLKTAYAANQEEIRIYNKYGI